MRAGSSGTRHIALIMMSDFDRDGGGRETWAYNFIPQLLESDAELWLTVYGMRRHGRDHTSALIDAVGPAHRRRLKVVLLEVKRGRLPYFFSMLSRLRAHANGTPGPPLEYTLGIGSLFEMLLMLSCQPFRASHKVLWLRGIFFNEKADRLPPALLGAARRTEQLLLSRADLLLTNGEDIRTHYARYGLQSVVIENGVDSRKWSLPSAGLGSVVRVGYVGRLSKVKGIEEFLALAERSSGSLAAAQFEFHLIGAGPYAEQARALQAQGKLIFHGHVANEQLPKALAQLDVCVALTFASASLGGGGTSNALMEQMAAGRVIIAWDNVIFRQLLDEQSAYLVAQGDVGGLLRALEDIAADRHAALLRARVARERIGAFTLEAQLARFHAALVSKTASNWRVTPPPLESIPQ